MSGDRTVYWRYGVAVIRGLLHTCVAYTGDVDTVAAIALAAAADTDELDHDLPEMFYTGLENGTFGHDHLATVTQNLRRACSGT